MRRLISAFLLFLLALLLLTGCDLLPANPQAVGTVEATPTATPDPSGYQAVAAQTCLIHDLSAIQAERRAAGMMQWLQGSLIAFQPGKDHLAYLAPAERTSWFTGELTLVAGPNFQTRVLLAPAVQVAGDLTWSPDGAWLAFLAFRTNEGVQTVMVVHDDGSGLTDLFPTDLARMDNRASQKAILGWKNANTVQVLTSCGEECRQAFDITVSAAATEPVLTPTQISDYHLLTENLKIPQRIPAYDPTAYPKNMTQPTAAPNSQLLSHRVPPFTWSPDDRLVAYLDKKGYVWVLSIEEKINYMVDIGLRDVIEMQWSADGQRLAVRAEDRIFIFEVPCTQ